MARRHNDRTHHEHPDTPIGRRLQLRLETHLLAYNPNIGDTLAFAFVCAVVTTYWRIGAIFHDKDDQDWADLTR